MADAKTMHMKLPWDAESIPNHSQPQFSIPPKQASVDPETVKELVELQEIATEGDKRNFMVSCVQGIFQKMVGILTGQPNRLSQVAVVELRRPMITCNLT